jgi:hypothetical protein
MYLRRSLCVAFLGSLVVAGCTKKAALPPSDPPPVEEGTPFCRDAGLEFRAFAEGGSGTHRGELAGDFTVDLTDGTQWHFKEQWAGCESYIFLPDTLVKSALDSTSLWKQDVDGLIEKSPRNVHYFFISRRQAEAAATATADLRALIDTTLASLEAENAEHWRAHLHVVKTPAGELTNWIKDVIGNGIGAIGFAIDRAQTIRGIGNLADVFRFNQQLQAQSQWPWESNLAYAAYEAKYFNAQADVQKRLAGEQATIVPLWKGETLEQFAETDAELPSAEQMAGFDTLEVEVTQACPDANKIEFNNCGAWDYLANLYVQDGANFVELARFITSYHRETHWVVDISPMLAHLKNGGKRHFKWEFAPEWNKQPTATKLSLRFSNRGKGSVPSIVQPLWMGHPRPFNSAYNEGLETFHVEIPADAKKVEFFALLTGHGGATNNCAEFCNHQHTLTVNGQEFYNDHELAQVNDGCVAEVENGMTPNQGGTWWFGRGGWCPGQQVKPWSVDLTELAPPGTTATLRYLGQYNLKPPPDNSGDIQLSSYLVISR